MFDSKDQLLKHRQQKENEELLEIFILIEENTMQTKVQALRRYCVLYDIKDKIKAKDLMKKAYDDFNNKKTKKS